RSIQQFVEGDYVIKVLDDGTSPVYLEKVKVLFPEVQIFTSPLYQQKWKAIKDHINGVRPYSLFSIPTGFWISHVKSASPFFLLLEDDIWLTDRFSLSSIIAVMRENNMVKLKVGWQGTPKVNQGKIKQLSLNIEQIQPNFSFINRVVVNNKFKIASVLHYLRLVNINSLLPFYSIYAVASAFFDKKYWLYLWDGASDKVKEEFQLRKALSWYDTKSSTYGKLINESSKTSYITSVNNSFSHIDFDMFRFNYYLNEAWLSGNLDVMNQFPKDFSVEYIRSFLDNANDERCNYLKWTKWVNQFKSAYRELGCEVY
ncbi:MAG TPA: hypothetical protein VD794_15590, partial [Flavisolibacter sp.]|nr:hypothetical protein [Flavisolibacter sp.]